MERVSIKFKAFNYIAVIRSVTERITEDGMLKLTYLDKGVDCQRWVSLDDISEVVITPIKNNS